MSISFSVSSDQWRTALLLLVAGSGGLLYGVDVGIIGGVLPYLEATSSLDAGQLSVIVAAVLLGSMFSTLFAGMLADWMGRKLLLTLSGFTFVLSIPIIALSHGYSPLFFGRLLQGMSGGLVGIVVPLYLAECLSPSNRGRGTVVFQWTQTFGIMVAALIGIFYSYRLEAIAHTASAAAIFHFKDQAWRHVFWMSLPSGVLFVIVSFFVAESPRWLYRKGKVERALKALNWSRSAEEAVIELREMTQNVATAGTKAQSAGSKVRETLFQRKYVYPFVLACVILFCNTATGINSIIGFNTNILLQSGLSDLQSHWGYATLTTVNFLATIIGMMLIDKKGRRFLLILGTSGVIASMIAVGVLFHSTESKNVDCRAAVQQMVTSSQTLQLTFTPKEARNLLASVGDHTISPGKASLAVIYSYGGFTGATTFVRSDEKSVTPIHITRASIVPKNHVEALFQNPVASLKTASTAPLKIQRAIIGQVPSENHGWLIALLLYCFIGFFAVGPGTVVWLALSELMPTRIRSNGMSIALALNLLVATVLAAIFLPVASKYGYSAMFFLFAAFTVIYLITAIFFLPETKGKTLEEIEGYFTGVSRKHRPAAFSHGNGQR